MRSIFAVILWLSCAASAFAFGGVVPTASLPIPTEASINGFTALATNLDANTGFDFDCSGTGTHSLWHNGLWQATAGSVYGGGYLVPCANITANAGGYIDLDWNIQFATNAGCNVTNGCPIPSISSANMVSQGRGYGHGYYEWRMAQSQVAPSAWPAGWILGLTTGQQCIAGGFNGFNTVASPGPEYSEIDTVEVFGFTGPTNINQTYHRGANDPDCGSGGGPLSDGFTPSASGVDFTQIHKYGLLWCGASSSGGDCTGTPKVCWYFDDTQTGCFNTISATETQMHMINAWMAQACGFGTGNANNAGCLGGATDLHNKVYSIRHWSCATWQTNALGC
jgi:hypothetical protein